jgi:hypothetical protein
MNKFTLAAALLSVLLSVLSACSPGQAATVEATPEPACEGTVCIRGIHASVSEDALLIEFELTDAAGNVDFGNAPRFEDDQLVALYAGEDYIAGFNLPLSMIECYSGNDIPWAGGEYAASCGFAFPIAQLEKAVAVGDQIRIENGTFEFTEIVAVQ